MDETETSNVVADVVDLVVMAEKGEEANNTIAAVIENANAAIERAEENAEHIAAAAMESARGERIEALERTVYTWQTATQEIQAQLQALSLTMGEMQGQISAMALLTVAAPSTAPLSLTPQMSEVETAITEVTEILPEAVQSAVAESPAAQQPLGQEKRRRWI